MKRKWKVTRTWYIEGNSSVDAIMKSRNVLHDEVKSVELTAQKWFMESTHA